MSNLVLIGFMGSGKSTIAKELAINLNLKVIDMDGDIEVEEGRLISEIFAEDGEAYFRRLETNYLQRASNLKTSILSTGGGVVVNPLNRPLLKDIGKVIFLQASVEHIMKNVKGDTKRPLLQGDNVEGKIRSMLEIREPWYYEAADVIIQTSGKGVLDIVKEIINIM